MKSSAGYTLAELVVTIAIVGILTFSAIPAFSKVLSDTQAQINLSNMETIKNVFVQYYYTTHMDGNPHFPVEPQNSMLDSTYRETLLDDGRTLDDLFNGDLPYNTNKKPFSYYRDDDTSGTGFITKRIVIKDVDLDSPSLDGYAIGEI
jgi:prepilin-type N-terminal cleavage/methylation domain-containing protein